jgi:hypothetical protein
MNPKELRIGNLINCIVHDEDEDGNDVVIKSEGKFIGYDPFDNYMWVESDLAREYYDEFEPIPVTEDHLRKFGFRETGIFLYLGNLSYDKIRKTWQWFGVMILPERLRFVHQLQNFVYSIDGKEL